MIDFEPASDGGLILPLLAQPKARQNAVTGEHDGRLKVAVTEAPEKGKANKAIVKVLAAALGLKKSQLEIVAGEASQRKKCRVMGIAPDDLRRRLAAALE
jgi:uncharacterized protein